MAADVRDVILLRGHMFGLINSDVSRVNIACTMTHAHCLHQMRHLLPKN